jgi:dolichyl-phosphate-mannose-protein mannosyltransferase
MTPDPARARSAGWSAVHLAALAGGLVVAVAVRALLLPTPGLSGDLDQFVLWVHGLATAPFGRAYDQNLSFPAVMVYVWGVLAAIEPAFRTVTDSADPAIRALMKTPASLADLGLALGIAWALRERPWWAVIGALGIALHPAVVDVSAWWGQYESIFTLAALVAYLLAAGGRPGWAAVAIGVALMTKPQALPLAVPFAAWYLGRFGLRGSLRYAAVAAATALLVWLPFLPAGGPLAYARNLAEYQGDIFAVLSLRAWNPWWLVQEAYGGGQFIADGAAILGPITLRHIGYVAALLLEGVVFLTVLRHPSNRTLALGLAAAALVAFVALTTMHERYAYAALVFLAVLLPDRRVLALWLVFGAAFTLNLLAAAPPTDAIRSALPVSGPLGVAGSVVMTGCAAATVWLLLAEGRRRPAAEPAAERGPVPVQVVG